MLRIVHTGKVTLKEVEASRHEAAEMTKASRIQRVLVDFRGARMDFGQIALHGFAATLRDHFLPGTRMAVMMERNDPNRRELEFVEDISYNRGFDLRLFTDDQKAWEWLTAGRAATPPTKVNVAGAAAGLNTVAKV